VACPLWGWGREDPERRSPSSIVIGDAKLHEPGYFILLEMLCAQRAHCLSRTLVLVAGTAAGDHVLSMPNVFILWAHNLPAAAKLINFAAFHWRWK